MRKPITFAIAVAITALFALVFWEVGMGVTGEDAAMAGSSRNYAAPPNHYTPIKRLGPVW